MNQIVTDVPFGDGTIEAHLDTSGGEMEMEMGHLENPDLTVTLDYATAKAILVDGNPQAGMQAFMAGKIKVQGDMTKMMAMQSGAPDPVAGRDRRQDPGDHRRLSHLAPLFGAPGLRPSGCHRTRCSAWRLRSVWRPLGRGFAHPGVAGCSACSASWL